MSLSTIKPLTALLLSTFLFYGAFSRLTHGQYTPQMHAYQTDRSPDDGSTLATVIPCMDLLFAGMVLLPRTRVAGAALCTSMMALGMIARRFEGKDPTMDAVITLAVFGCWMVLGRVEW
jgi:hypothetical protein